MQISGTIPPMVTPTLARDGGVDVPTLRSFTGSLVDGGVHALFPNGSAGEFSSLTRAERRTVVETVVETADGTPVIAGCGGTSVGDVLAGIDDAAEAGADAAVVVTPYYLSTRQSGLREFYETVATRSPLPVVLYNIPQLTGVSLDVETVTALSDHDDIVGIKDSSGGATYHFRLVENTPEDFSVVQGITTLATASLDAGSDGIVTGTANVFPGAMVDLYDAHVAGDRDRAARLLKDVVIPVSAGHDGIPTAVAMKYLVRRGGTDVGPPLLPLPELSAEEERRLGDAYDAVVGRLEATG
ncbi:dihydrodipicolinate synthase family protein [Halorarum salinum]|uniref:Dihydrodipicolinate synthase family protein n=1 Tax=Halorarum salinum TaxID=2743089 RepID=A0A7D5QBH1_9EURY|nr:dihydrodipicolinate synthase family protein [Halobaculum salinum]QLG61780.1 dihydrodipicolinate synthase family protein [Halobaculum salinum]